MQAIVSSPSHDFTPSLHRSVCLLCVRACVLSQDRRPNICVGTWVWMCAAFCVESVHPHFVVISDRVQRSLASPCCPAGSRLLLSHLIYCCWLYVAWVPPPSSHIPHTATPCNYRWGKSLYKHRQLIIKCYCNSTNWPKSVEVRSHPVEGGWNSLIHSVCRGSSTCWRRTVDFCMTFS